MNKVYFLAIMVGCVAAVCPTDKAKCTDSNVNCDFWSRNRQCTENPKWMEVNCAKSCCESCQVPKLKAGECPTTEQHSMCVANKNSQCETFATDVEDAATGDFSNECEKNPAWMIPNCMSSCCPVCQEDKDKCPTVKSGCLNDIKGRVADCTAEDTKKEACEACFDNGVDSAECKAAQDGTPPASLKCLAFVKCKASEDAVAAGDKKCKDWAARGECSSNAEWMNPNCPEQCCSTCGTVAAAPVLPAPLPFAPLPVPTFGGYNFGGYGGFPAPQFLPYGR